MNRKKWKTRVELANAIFGYIEIFHNRQRRDSALGYRTPIEYETLEINNIPRELATNAGTKLVGQVKLSPFRSSRPPEDANKPVGAAK